MSPPSPILKFERVALESGELYESAVWDITFELGPGDLMLVLLDPEHLLLPLADAAQGLITPLAQQSGRRRKHHARATASYAEGGK